MEVGPDTIPCPTMASASTACNAADRLLELACRLERHTGFVHVLAALKAEQSASLDGVWGACRALLAVPLARHAPGPVVVV